VVAGVAEQAVEELAAEELAVQAPVPEERPVRARAAAPGHPPQEEVVQAVPEHRRPEQQGPRQVAEVPAMEAAEVRVRRAREEQGMR
jgi:hypothetical protein